MTHPAVPVLSLLIAATLWGLSWIPLRALEDLGFQGVFVVLSGQVILTILFFPLGFKSAILKQNWRALIGIFIAGGGAILCFTYAMIYGDVVRVMVLFYLLPVWGVLGGRLFLGEHIDALRWLGVGCALLGAFFILGAHTIFDEPPTWMDFIAFLSGFLFAANNLCFRGLDAVPLPSKLLAMFFGCTVISGITLVLIQEPLPFDQPAQSFFWLVLYAITYLLLANVLSQWAVTQMEAGRSSIIIIMELFAAVISAIIIGERTLTHLEIFGCCLVVGAALLEATRSTPSDDQLVSPIDSGELKT